MQCTIQFIIEAQTVPQQKILLVGSHQSIGNWDPSKGYHLSTTNLHYPQWSTGNIIFPRCSFLLIVKKFQFKFVKLKLSNQYLWQSLPGNRKYKPKHSNIILKTYWSQARGKQVTKQEQIQDTQQSKEQKTSQEFTINKEIPQFDIYANVNIYSQDSDEQNILTLHNKTQWHSKLFFQDDSSVIYQTYNQLIKKQDKNKDQIQIQVQNSLPLSHQIIIVLANFFPNLQQNNQDTQLLKNYVSKYKFLWYAPQQLPPNALTNFKKYDKRLPPKTPIGIYFFHQKIISNLFFQKLKNRKINQIALFQIEKLKKYLYEKGWKVINKSYNGSQQKKTQINILNVDVIENKIIEITDSNKIESKNQIKLKISEICNNFFDGTLKNRIIIIDGCFVFSKQNKKNNSQSTIKIKQKTNKTNEYKKIRSTVDLYELNYRNQIYAQLNLIALYQNISIILVTNDSKKDFLEKTQGQPYNFTVVSTNWFNQGGIEFYQVENNDNKNVSIQNILFKSILLNLFFKKGVIDFLIVISQFEYVFQQIQKLQQQKIQYIKVKSSNRKIIFSV